MARAPVYSACLVAALVMAGTVRFASFTAWGTDPAAYLMAAHQWAAGALQAPDAFQLWDPPLAIGIPLGSRQGAVPGTYVTIYPLGFPLLLAVGVLADADLGAYVIPPLFAGVLVMATFAVARHVTNDWWALLASVLVALNPIVLAHAVTPMSDVPAAALLMLSIAMSVRPGVAAAAAAGACMAMAVMTRAILLPIAVVPFALALTYSSFERWTRAAVFVLFVAIGPAVLAWSQAVLYGSPFTPGYPQFEIFFSRDRVLTNAAVYLRNLTTIHTPAIFIGLVATVPLYFARALRRPAELRVITALLALIGINYAVYLPYLTYDDVWSTRFVLPLQIALIILLAAAIGYAAQLVARVWKPLAAVCAVPAVIIAYEGAKLLPLLLYAYSGQSQVRAMGHYLREALPRNAAVVSMLHSGAVAHYAGATVVRYDFFPRGRDAERLIERLEARGYHVVFVLDQHNEGATYKMALQGTAFERMEWRSRAHFQNPGSSEIWYVDAVDRHAPERAQITDWVQ